MANEVRLTGIANVAAGVFLGLFVVLHPFSGEFGSAAIVLSTPWALVHTFGLISALLTVFGLIGICRWLTPGGGIALVGYVLATLGSILQGAGAVVNGYFVPALAAANPALIAADGPLLSFPAVLAFVVPKFLLFLPGFVLLGVDLLRSTTPQKPAAVMLIAGTVLLSAAVAPWPVIVAGGLLFGVAQVLLGMRLLKV